MTRRSPEEDICTCPRIPIQAKMDLRTKNPMSVIDPKNTVPQSHYLKLHASPDQSRMWKEDDCNCDPQQFLQHDNEDAYDYSNASVGSAGSLSPTTNVMYEADYEESDENNGSSGIPHLHYMDPNHGYMADVTTHRQHDSPELLIDSSNPSYSVDIPSCYLETRVPTSCVVDELTPLFYRHSDSGVSSTLLNESGHLEFDRISQPSHRKVTGKLSDHSLHSNFSEDSLMVNASHCTNDSGSVPGEKLPTIAQDSQEELTDAGSGREDRHLQPKGASFTAAWWEDIGEFTKSDETPRRPSSGERKSRRTNDIVPVSKEPGDHGGRSLRTPKHTPMAFTVDLSPSDGNKLDIGDSISKFVPKGKRIASASVTRESRNSPKASPSESQPLSPKSTGSRGQSKERRRPVSLNRALPQSQRERQKDTPTENDRPSPQDSRLARRATVTKETSPTASRRLPGPPSQTTKGRNPDTSQHRKNHTHPNPAVLNESASYLIQRMLDSTPEPSDESVQDDGRDEDVISTPEPDLVLLDSRIPAEVVSHTEEDDEVVTGDDDDRSEAGTYTIDKDVVNPEMDQARAEFDKLLNSMSRSENTVVTPTPPRNTFDNSGTYRKRDKNVTSPPAAVTNVTNHLPPSPKLSASLESTSRPRRILPTPPAKPPSPSVPGRDFVFPPAATHGAVPVSSHSPPLDTEAYLRDTENLVTALQARVSNQAAQSSVTHSRHSPSTGSVPLRSPRAANSRVRAVVGASTERSESSDSSSEISDRGIEILSDMGASTDTANKGSKQNRAFQLRRNRLCHSATESSTARSTSRPQSHPAAPKRRSGGPAATPSSGGGSNHSLSDSSHKGGSLTPRSAASSSAFGRNDGGRFSLRVSRNQTPPASSHHPTSHVGRTPVPHTQSPVKRPLSKQGRPPSGSSTGGGGASGMSRSTTSTPAVSKEQEFANWQRRKRYDPLKAAAEGRKKVAAKRAESATRGSSLMAQSSHEGEAASSHEDEHAPSFSLSKSASFGGPAVPAVARRRPHDFVRGHDPVPSQQMGAGQHLSVRERVAMAKATPVHRTSAPSPSRDTSSSVDPQVVASVFALSNKLVHSSQEILEKLSVQLSDETEVASKIEDLLFTLESGLGSPSRSVPSNTASKDMTNTLKNLKRMEAVLAVVDEVLSMDPTADDDDGEEAHYNGYHASG